MPLDETTRGLLDTADALLQAVRRLQTLAARLHARAVTGPPLSAVESADVERELGVTDEAAAVLESYIILFRQDLRRM